MKQDYSFWEKITNGLNLIYTKLFWPNARLIRRPFYCRGAKHVSYKQGLTTGYSCRFEIFDVNEKGYSKMLRIGENCRFGDRVHISVCDKILIGDNCLFASNILVTDNEHGAYKGEVQTTPEVVPNERILKVSPVEIGNNVWVGENVVILPGVHIGDGCVIGANAVVNHDIPSNSIAGGCRRSA